MNNVTIRANNAYSAPEGKATQTQSTKSCNAAPLLINTIYTVAESMTTQEPASSRSVLIERVLIFCASSLKVTEHVVVRLNIYWGVSLHCHYHLDQFIKQQDTRMMRKLGLLNKTGNKNKTAITSRALSQCRCALWTQTPPRTCSTRRRGHWAGSQGNRWTVVLVMLGKQWLW